jgi:hypothetical protein
MRAVCDVTGQSEPVSAAGRERKRPFGEVVIVSSRNPVSMTVAAKPLAILSEVVALIDANAALAATLFAHHRVFVSSHVVSPVCRPS